MQKVYERMRKTEIAIYESKFYFYCVKNDIKSMKDNEWSDLKQIEWACVLSSCFSLFFFIFTFSFLLMIKKQL